MPVTSTKSRVDVVGNGTPGPYQIDFFFFLATDLLVVMTDSTASAINPNVTELMMGTDYSISGAGNALGGSLTMLGLGAAPLNPTALQRISIIRQPPLTQLTVYPDSGPFPAKSHQNALDLLTMQNQELQEEIRRSATLPPYVAAPAAMPQPISGTILGWLNGAWVWVASASASLGLSLLDASSNALGDALMIMKQPFTGSVARTQHDKNADNYTETDAGAVGDGITNDHAAIQALLDTGRSIKLAKNATYKVLSPLIVSTGNRIIDLNGSTITYPTNQSHTTTSVYDESLFIASNVDNVTICNGKLVYTGEFDPVGGGNVAGILVDGCVGFEAHSLDISGFNYNGIACGYTLSNTSPCNRVKIHECYCHENRVAGIGFCQTIDSSVTNCDLKYNGKSGDPTKGYGFAGASFGSATRTTISGNRAHANWRKGIDFHAGEDGVVTGNICNGNAMYGIFVEGVTGSWVIDGNVVADMDPTTVVSGQAAAISVGNSSIANSIPTSFTVSNNEIRGLAQTTRLIVGIGVYDQELNPGCVVIRGNTIDADTIESFIWTDNTVSTTNPYDIYIEGNTCSASSVTGTPFLIRSASNRVKTFKDNNVQITSATLTGGVYTYSNTSVTGASLSASGNTIVAPDTLWSSVYDPIPIKRTTSEIMTGTIINAVTARDWDGFRYVFHGTTYPSTGYWTRESIVWKSDVAASATPGYVCTTTGLDTAAKWADMAVLSAAH